MVGRDLELIPSLRVEFGLKICGAETELPVKLLAVVEFVKVELGEAAHRSNHLAGHARMILNRLLLIEGPMSRRQDFHVDFQTCGHVFKHVAILEILAQLFADLDVLEHHLQLLRVHQAALFFQLKQERPFRIFIDVPLLEQPLSERILIMAFEHVFVLEVPKDLDYLVDPLHHVTFLNRFKLGLEHLI